MTAPPPRGAAPALPATPPAEHRRSCITEAARLVAGDPGAADRLLAAHPRRADGRCAGCGPTLVSWPCVLVVIGKQALELAAARPRPRVAPKRIPSTSRRDRGLGRVPDRLSEPRR